MATGGRVVHHLAAFLPDERSSVVLVGYQAPGTRGQALLAGARELKMRGRYVRVRAQVVNLPAFSVHADADEIIGWLRTSTGTPRGVFLVHGEPSASRAARGPHRRRAGLDGRRPAHRGAGHAVAPVRGSPERLELQRLVRMRQAADGMSDLASGCLRV